MSAKGPEQISAAPPPPTQLPVIPVDGPKPASTSSKDQSTSATPSDRFTSNTGLYGP